MNELEQNELEKQLVKAIRERNFGLALTCLNTSEKNRISNTGDIISNLSEDEMWEIFEIVIREDRNMDVLIGLLREAPYPKYFPEKLCAFAIATNPTTHQLNTIILNSKFSIEALTFTVIFSNYLRSFIPGFAGIGTYIPSCVRKLHEFHYWISCENKEPKSYFQAQASFLSALELDYKFVFLYFSAILDELANFSSGYQIVTCHAKSYDANTIKVLINTLCTSVMNMQRMGLISELESKNFYEELLNFQLTFNPESDVRPILANGSGHLFQSRKEFAAFFEPLLRNDLFDTFKSRVERWNGSFWKDASTQTEPTGLTYSDQEQSAMCSNT